MIPMKDQEMKDLEPKEDKKVQGKMNKKDIKDVDIKDDKALKKGATKMGKMEVEFVKGEAKKEKMDGVKTTKSFRPSSTPPSGTGNGMEWVK